MFPPVPVWRLKIHSACLVDGIELQASIANEGRELQRSSTAVCVIYLPSPAGVISRTTARACGCQARGWLPRGSFVTSRPATPPPHRCRRRSDVDTSATSSPSSPSRSPSLKLRRRHGVEKRTGFVAARLSPLRHFASPVTSHPSKFHR